MTQDPATAKKRPSGEVTTSSSSGEDHGLVDPTVNERLTPGIKKELWFRLGLLPSRIARKTGPVPLCLLFLWLTLLYSNSYGPLGYWEGFIQWSTSYRTEFLKTGFARAVGFDSPGLNAYSLWRGVVVISVSTSLTYICVSLLALRHELYHWKPDLLNAYLADAKSSFPGKYLPESWLDQLFNLYETGHAKRVRNRIQARDHRATEDHHELTKIVRRVSQNLLISVVMVLVMWIALLQTNFDSHNIVQLPRSYVPLAQGVVWYIINDTFYYFPHYIAHTPRGTKGIHHKVLPNFLADRLGVFLRNAHKTHHRSKANLAVAAWYCSSKEQVLFNLFPAMVGPVITQIIADKTGHSEIWGTHLIVLYVWLLAGTATSVLAHMGFRTNWNDPGKHDEHHEYAFGHNAVNFGTAGIWDRVFGTMGTKAPEGAKKWEQQREHQAALVVASRRTGVPLTKEQKVILEQPADYEWVDKRVDE